MERAACLDFWGDRLEGVKAGAAGSQTSQNDATECRDATVHLNRSASSASIWLGSTRGIAIARVLLTVPWSRQHAAGLRVGQEQAPRPRGVAAGAVPGCATSR